MPTLKGLNISPAELKHVRNLVKEFKKDGFSADEAIKKAIKQMLTDSESELASIEQQIKAGASK